LHEFGECKTPFYIQVESILRVAPVLTTSIEELIRKDFLLYKALFWAGINHVFTVCHFSLRNLCIRRSLKLSQQLKPLLKMCVSDIHYDLEEGYPDSIDLPSSAFRWVFSNRNSAD
jgi:hypothetical protein